MKLLLIRHGQTDWNVLGKIQGITDIPLNETGIKQAENARNKLLNENIDVIISSPLKRAKETAQIIADGKNAPIILDEQLKERCFGDFEGKMQEEFNFNEVWNYKLNKQYKDLESVGALFKRIENFLQEIKKEYKDKTILIVTHGAVITVVRAILEGIPEGMEILKGFDSNNCEIKKYEL